MGSSGGTRASGGDVVRVRAGRRVGCVFTRDGDDGRYRRDNSRHRYAWPAELDLMARLAGLQLERRVADWDGAPFTQDSAKHISVWRKPA